MFGPGNGPLINRLQQRYMQPPAPAPFIPPTPIMEAPSPRPDPVGHMYPQAGEPPTIEKAIGAINAALLEHATSDEAKELFRDWQAFSERLTSHLKNHKDSRLAELRKQDEELTTQGRETIDRINALQRDASEIRGSFNIQEETRSQLQLKVQALGPDPTRRNDPSWDPDESFVLPEEVERWRARFRDATAKVQTQEALVSGIRDRLLSKENEIEKARRELGRIKEARKRVRDELAGADPRGPFGLQGRTGHTR